MISLKKMSDDELLLEAYHNTNNICAPGPWRLKKGKDVVSIVDKAGNVLLSCDRDTYERNNLDIDSVVKFRAILEELAGRYNKALDDKYDLECERDSLLDDLENIASITQVAMKRGDD